MSFSVGGSDVIVGLKVAWQIYQWGFVDENRADVRYKNFQNDIFNFRYLLERLNESLQNAQLRYQNRGPVFGVQPYEPLGSDFEEERKAIVGNFLATLKECETLLEGNRHFRERCSNVWENLHYNLSQQEPRVDLLRRRLHFHSEKIRLVLDWLSVNLLTDMDAKVDDILAMSEQNLPVSREIQVELSRIRASWLGYVSGNGVTDAASSADYHTVSNRIAERLQDQILVDAPPGIQSPSLCHKVLMYFSNTSNKVWKAQIKHPRSICNS
ncbi:hypothetical protein CLAFUW4_11183 [Fulvia fulva]|uniref:Uncharacterized protein n=1 Tax=Passalora fulva TaxID=5499 RepID=A0A9Q8URW1_PASFU|nr:uncharacterized protein CLAFUR5_10226 [Fulvia fulva]KAK4620171.1 hypothetical protein CLAFUR4_11188 [Fulvia fulva]KAK4620763.1 hypothetical protein CLAFUR0_11193 [Fulvia fulva]UJO20153.1 hypothetical protein CLAFUR5_10226 [Fulvia fulva]WPV17455.1 hypothetical protein CLAFUW4_11183 [Fulvia fulva]WPV32291.1 hypothetical protein CLAFUW7_11179 [Fulvia fulva]